ncbi:hypothetical protein QCA50_009695 [Cerrena zonata]|uniref:Uncharacterized protein n=1 Tax=Cerrena zonata TaxID=2478898 RepID=A0AAW0G2E2_9APHY
MSSDLTPFLAERYSIIKATYPGEGRRRWRLRVADEFFKLSSEQKVAYGAQSVNPSLPPSDSAPYFTDEDPLDVIAGENAPGLGIVVRADYSDENAWNNFLEKLKDAENEFVSELGAKPEDDGDVNMDEDVPEGQASSNSNSGANAVNGVDDDSEDEDEDEDNAGSQPMPIFAIFNPSPESGLRSLLASTRSPSNLTILRLFTDVNVRRAPIPPQDVKRIKPLNRLVDSHQWQEVYKGKGIWVYDARSNQDQTVRVVSLEGSSSYGTATADSWRARVSHICELQFNLSLGMLTIDFGGMDRYDYEERIKNMEEAERGIV